MKHLWALAPLLALAACQPHAPNATAIAGANHRPRVPSSPVPASVASSGPASPSGPSPAPHAATAAGASLTLGSGPVAGDLWRLGPPLARARAGMGVGVLADDSLVVADGENRPSVERFVFADGARGLSGADDLGHPDGGGPYANDGFVLVTSGADATGLLMAGGYGNGASSAGIYHLGAGGIDAVPGRLNRPVQAAAGGVIAGVLVVAGGLSTPNQPVNGQVVADVQRFDLSSKTGVLGRPMPHPVAGAASAVLGGKLYVMGGYALDAAGNPQGTRFVQVYDLAANAWRTSDDGRPGAPAPLAFARHSAAAAPLAGKIYLAGGSRDDNTPTGDASVYDPANSSWTPLAVLPTPRALLALVGWHDELWAIGGVGADGRTLATVEVYHP